jgi:hypothetical protein
VLSESVFFAQGGYMTKEKIGKFWQGLQRGLGAFTPGATITTSTGTHIDVSANGTTSVSSEQLAKAIQERFSEMHEPKDDAA